MLNAVVIASVLASVASASLAQRDAPLTVTNTVTVTSCPAHVSDCAASTKYITVPCTAEGASPAEASGAPAHPPPPPAGSAAAAAPAAPGPPPPAGSPAGEAAPHGAEQPPAAGPAPPAATGGAAPAAPASNDKNATASKPVGGEGEGCPAYGCGTELPIATSTVHSTVKSTVAVPSSSGPAGSPSAKPTGPVVSRASGSSAPLGVGIAMVVAALALF